MIYVIGTTQSGTWITQWRLIVETVNTNFHCHIAELVVRGAICSPLTETLYFNWSLLTKQKNIGLRLSCVASWCAICLPREKEIRGASIWRLINEGRNKSGCFLQQCLSNNTVRLEKLRDIQQLSYCTNFYCCLCRTKECVGYSPTVAWPADTHSLHGAQSFLSS